MKKIKSLKFVLFLIYIMFFANVASVYLLGILYDESGIDTSIASVNNFTIVNWLSLAVSLMMTILVSILYFKNFDEGE